ncbi:MAG: SpoIIE family protein phosphatase [Pedococcus sp.]
MTEEESLDGFHQALLEDDPAALYDSAPCGYLTTTPDGLVAKANATFLTIAGLSAEELMGRRTFVSLLTPGGRIYYETHLGPMLQANGRISGVALELVTREGARLPVLVNAVMERDEGGRARRIRLAVFDATERRAYERELMRAKQAAEELQDKATALARTLQQVLMPPQLPDIPGLELAAAFRPAHDGAEIGGDFYDIFPTPDGGWLLAIGDVCGKGAEAAVVTSLVRHALRLMVADDRLDVVMPTLNETLLRHSERFATVLLIHLQRETSGWAATVCSAGHPLPLLVRDGRPAESHGSPGSLVGAADQASFTQTRTTLNEGDALLLFTDGIPDGRRAGAFYGDERLAALAAETGEPHLVVDRILEDVFEFQRGDPADDMALLMVRVAAPPHTTARS